jgi:non-specific serine/threonine protein kinase
MRWRALATVAVVALVALAGCRGGRPAPERAPLTSAAPADGEPAWRTLAPAPSERTEVAAAAVGERIWVLGGYAPDGATLATVEVYDTATDTWARGPDLPVAVNHAMAATLDGVLYIAGGNDGDGPSTQVARLEGDGWRRLAPLPQGRSAGGLVALDGRLYLVGGVVAGGRAALAELPAPRGGLAASATAGGEVVAVGGEAAATFPEAEALEVASGRWRSLPPLPTPRHGLGVVAVGDTVYVLAGGPRPGLHTSAANEAIDLG